MRRKALLYGLALWAFLLLAAGGAAQHKFEKAERFTAEDGLPGNVVRFIKKGKDGFVWIGTTDGLCRFDGAQFKVYQHDPEDPNSIMDNRATCIAVDTHELWVGTHAGLSRLDLITEKFTHYQFNEKGRLDSIRRMDGQQIHSLLKDRNGDLWAGTRDWGLARYLPEKDDFKMYRGDQDEVAKFFPEPRNIHNILSLEQHRFRDSILWAGTANGVLEINKYTNRVEWLAFNLEIPVEKRWGNIFKTMYHHSDGLVYAGNWGGGITVFDPERRSVKLMEVKSHPGAKVLNGGTQLMVEKSKEEFWITTSSGLALYHSGKKEITFHKINSEEVSYGVEFVDEQHRAWAKSGQGLFVFDPLLQQFDVYAFSHFAEPDELRYNQETPQPYLTGINVLEESFPDGTSPVFTKELRLRHWQNFFSFDFSARGFTFGKHNRFRYRLKGFDENWIMAKGRRNANYTNVPGGAYIFQLQAANNEGIWNEKLYELPVYIASPWWARWWFIAGALLLGAALAYRLYRYRVRQIRREEQLKAEFEKRLADVEMSALRAQMNPHFLFNCLNSIDSYIIKNETRKASEYLNNFARLIRLILQNSRVNYVSLKDEVEAIELYLQMENLRFRDKFTYEICIAEGVDPALVDIPPMLIQPYVENAIWHGLMHKEDKSQGKVTFSVAKENGFLKCAVEDNGVGREKARELKASRPLRGQQSYGMRITHDRISIINKLYNSNTSVQVIDLKDEQQNPLGTRVELCIPV